MIVSYKDRISSSCLLFRYGFLLHDKSTGALIDISVVRSWNVIHILDAVIYIHPECLIRQYKFGENVVVLLGEVYSDDQNKTIDELIEQFIVHGDYDSFDHLSGRFSLIDLSPTSGRIFNDPFGSRTIYYYARELCVSSHSTLIAMALGLVESDSIREFIKAPQYKARGTTYLPGDLTLYDSIYGLSPNNYYDIVNNKTFRYFPRGVLIKSDIKSFLSQVELHFARYSEYIRDRFVPVFGLTGGVDSRAAIAAFIGNKVNIKTITWDRISDDEKVLVNQMKDHLKVEHIYLDLKYRDDSSRFADIRNISNYNSGCVRGPSSMTAQMALLYSNNNCFIRGLGGEIMRGFYNRHAHCRGVVSKYRLEDLPKLYLTSKVKCDDSWFVKFSSNAINEFFDRANYVDIQEGYDIADLFYWEQRMGMWAANLLNESDPALLNLVAFNSRRLYNLSFGLDPSERLGSSLLLKITSLYDLQFSKI